MFLVLLGLVFLIAAAAAGTLYHFKGYPKVLRFDGNTVVVTYKYSDVSRILYWVEKRVWMWSKEKVETLQTSYELHLNQQYYTKDGVSIQINTTIYAFTETPQILPVVMGIDWNVTYARMLANKAVKTCISEVDMMTLSSNVVEIIEKVNAYILAESRGCPLTLRGVTHEFGELNKVSIYKTEFQIREAVKRLDDSQSEEATA